MKKAKNTRETILQEALDMASHLGLESITIGQLALRLKMSKSGLFAHFQSKENLQLAILSHAASDFKYYVLLPALATEAGIPRIKKLVNNWIGWGERLTGGCIFVNASIEYSERKGKIHDFVLFLQEEWIDSLVKIAESAIRTGDFEKDIDTKQFAYELYSMLLGFHYYHRMLKDKDIRIRQEKALDRLIRNYQVAKEQVYPKSP